MREVWFLSALHMFFSFWFIFVLGVVVCNVYVLWSRWWWS